MKDYLVIIASVAVVGFLLVGRGGGGDSAKSENREPRTVSRNLASEYLGRSIPAVQAQPRPGAPIENVSLTSPGLKVIVLLGKEGCSPCQSRELRHLRDLELKWSDSVTFLGLYFNKASVGERTDYFEIDGYKKVSQIGFPIYNTRDDPSRGVTQKDGVFPTILVLEGAVVIASHVPIATDPDFSVQFYDALDAFLQDGSMDSFDLDRIAVDLTHEDWLLRSIGSGEIVYASTLIGPGGLFLHEWATWCAPCISELPTVRVLQLTEPSIGFALVARDDAQVVQEFVESSIGVDDVFVSVGGRPVQLPGSGLPTTHLVLPTGVVRHSLVGARDWRSQENRELVGSLVSRKH